MQTFQDFRAKTRSRFFNCGADFDGLFQPLYISRHHRKLLFNRRIRHMHMITRGRVNIK